MHDTLLCKTGCKSKSTLWKFYLLLMQPTIACVLHGGNHQMAANLSNCQIQIGGKHNRHRLVVDTGVFIK